MSALIKLETIDKEKLSQVLDNEAFYVFRTGGKVWIESVTCGQVVELIPAETRAQSASKWFSEHSRAYLDGLSAPINYWVE